MINSSHISAARRAPRARRTPSGPGLRVPTTGAAPALADLVAAGRLTTPATAGRRNDRVKIRSVSDAEDRIAVTSALIGAVAQELWRLHGGNDVLNWLEAEIIVNEAFVIYGAVGDAQRPQRKPRTRTDPSPIAPQGIIQCSS